MGCRRHLKLKLLGVAAKINIFFEKKTFYATTSDFIAQKITALHINDTFFTAMGISENFYFPGACNGAFWRWWDRRGEEAFSPVKALFCAEGGLWGSSGAVFASFRLLARVPQGVPAFALSLSKITPKIVFGRCFFGKYFSDKKMPGRKYRIILLWKGKTRPPETLAEQDLPDSGKNRIFALFPTFTR